MAADPVFDPWLFLAAGGAMARAGAGKAVGGMQRVDLSWKSTRESR